MASSLLCDPVFLGSIRVYLRKSAVGSGLVARPTSAFDAMETQSTGPGLRLEASASPGLERPRAREIQSPAIQGQRRQRSKIAIPGWHVTRAPMGSASCYILCIVVSRTRRALHGISVESVELNQQI